MQFVFAVIRNNLNTVHNGSLVHNVIFEDNATLMSSHHIFKEPKFALGSQCL